MAQTLSLAVKERALALAQQGRLEEARLCFLHALQLQPQDAYTHNNLGMVLLHLGRLLEAMRSFQTALRLQPDHADAHFNLGYVLQNQGQMDQAVGCYRQALQLKPNHVDALNNLGTALMDRRQLDEAEACYRRALLLKPDHVDALTNLGIVLLDQGRLDQALASFRQALQLRPGLADALNGLGGALAKQGKISEALACYEAVLRQHPSNADAHLNRGILWLLLGDWLKGWPEYEWRWQTKSFPRPSHRQPRWDGAPLAGRNLLVENEQGLGDTLQFIRYLPLLRQCGGRVILRCQRPLLRLLSSCVEVEGLVAEGDPLPPFDVHAPLLSLPGLLGTTPENVPAAIPYLHADATLVQHWRRQLEPLAGFKVGIAWQGSPVFSGDRLRSIPLAHFARLAQVRGVQLVSLQKGPGTEQLPAAAAQFPVLDLGDRLDEDSGAFMDTAAVVMNLDLIIASDSAVAHLAGALGAPVWVALSLLPDWRWLLERQDTTWYPTMRLFRQARQGDWDDVFERIAAQLEIEAGREN